MEWLRSQEPQIVSLDFANFRTREEWIRAGEVVFAGPNDHDFTGNAQQFGDPAYYRSTGILLSKDGTVPYTRYVIREKGKVEVGYRRLGHVPHSRDVGSNCREGSARQFSLRSKRRYRSAAGSRFAAAYAPFPSSSPDAL
jgi:hypothetical protein